MTVDPTLLPQHLNLIRWWQDDDPWVVHMGNETPPEGYMPKPLNRERYRLAATVEAFEALRSKAQM